MAAHAASARTVMRKEIRVLCGAGGEACRLTLPTAIAETAAGDRLSERWHLTRNYT